MGDFVGELQGMEKLRKHIKKFARDLEAIIENTYDGLYITDGDANTLMINQAYERIAGIKRVEILGKNMRDLVASGVIDRSVSVEVIDKKRPVTIMQELRNGKKVLVTGSPVFDKDNGAIVLVVTNVRDITELMELKDKLHERTLEANRYLAELDKMKILQQQKIKFATKSKKILEILELAIKAAQFDSNILITGESGVGKGLMTRLIHESSSRKDQPFIVINCAGIPEDLFESELFGYDPGAFSGASTKGKKGLLEVADKGTVFLDEIGDMSLRLQSKLLRVIEEKEMTRLGSTKTVKLNIRIISATNQDMPTLIEHKKFRQDLYFRVNVIPIHVPSLRERKEDIPVLVDAFLEKSSKQAPGKKKTLTEKALKLLIDYDWPGNVRELKNLMERISIMVKQDLIDIPDIPRPYSPEPKSQDSGRNDFSLYEDDLEQARKRFEKEYLLQKITMEKGDIISIAKKLGTSVKYIKKAISESE